MQRGGPIIKILLDGPFGIGKSQTAKVIARELGRPHKIIPMSRYATDYSVKTVLETPWGLVDSYLAGDIWDILYRYPTGVIEFQEIDQAHTIILNSFFNILDRGSVFKDNLGRKVDISNMIFFFTTNASASFLAKSEDEQRRIAKEYFPNIDANTDLYEIPIRNIIDKVTHKLQIDAGLSPDFLYQALRI